MNKQIFVTGAVTESRPYRSDLPNYGDVEGVGTLRWVGDKLYQWVQNRHSAALAAGDVVYHSFADGADAEKWVSRCTDLNLGYMAGVVASTAIDVGTTTPAVDYSDAGYGWIICQGYYPAAAILSSTSTAAAAGATLFGQSGLLTVAPGLGRTVMGTAPLYTRNLLLLEAVTTATTAAAGTAKVYVNCR
jgi:hypothetical protein